MGDLVLEGSACDCRARRQAHRRRTPGARFPPHVPALPGVQAEGHARRQARGLIGLGNAVPVVADGSPLAFPCDFPIKVMGRKQPRFVQSVTGIVRKHAPDFDAATVEMRPSRQGTYLSVTCVMRATSREQLDALYQELCDHPDVVMVL